MSRYLDPKADLTFKKVFGEHKDLMISFLNALLPLSKDGEVKSIEYLPLELVPENPLKKDTIVDVRCQDQKGRAFIVEMQMIWTPAFMKRVLFNSSKAYVRQLDKGGEYEDLQPVYSLNLVNDTFRDDTDDYYHDYGLMDIKEKNHVIKDMHMIFIELPKFKPNSYNDKKMMVLWLRFLTEIDEKTRKAPEELLDNPETRKALDIVEESAYNDVEMATYDRFWDMVSRERTLVSSATKKGEERGMAKGMKEGLAKGMEKGLAKGMEKGLAKGMEKGIEKAKCDIVKKMLSMKVPVESIMQFTGLSKDEIEALK